jgi:seryl-tRNA synthetase
VTAAICGPKTAGSVDFAADAASAYMPVITTSPRALTWQIDSVQLLWDHERGTPSDGSWGDATFFSIDLRNAAALLELALVNWAITKVVARGFTPIMTPDLVKESVLEKCGFQPRGTNTQVDKSCNFGYVKITPSPHTFV